MSFEMYEKNDALMAAFNEVVRKDQPTVTSWMTEEQLLEHYDNVQKKNAVKSVDIEYRTVFNELVKQIQESTDTKMKNTLETLCFVLMKEHEETEIVSEDVLTRLSKISSLEVIKESSVELFEAKASKVLLPLVIQGKLFQESGSELAEEIATAINEEAINSKVTVESVSYDSDENSIIISTYGPADKNDLKELAIAVDDWYADNNYDTRLYESSSVKFK
jgi:polyhydroxyalkanoate synthesis regulator phasin